MANQIVVSAGAKVRNLQDVIIGTSGVLTSLGFDVANGVPRLDVNGKILVSQLPNSVMEYKGVWNAATNTPTLVNGTGNQGDVYLCNVAGTVDFGAGAIAFFVGDQVIYSGSIWQRASGATGSVTSVAITESGDSLNITGSPITTSGTINIGFNGTNLQYVNGAGNLTTFPDLSVYVTLAGTQTITGSKTFSSTALFDTSTLFKKVGSPYITSAGYTSLQFTASGTNTSLYITDGDSVTSNRLIFKNNAGYDYTFPAASGTIALTSDIPILTGYVPYTGATANVDLGTFNLTADVITGATGSFASSGGSDTFAINHSSGSGIALNITKGGNGEGLYINKTSGSGNAATIIGTLNATTLVKSGGTSSQFLKADGTVDSTAYQSALTLTTTGTSGAATLVGATLNIPQYQAAGTYVTSVTASAPLSSSGSTNPNITISQATTSTDGYLSSTDFNTFNNKISGLGTAGYITRYTGSGGTIGNSGLYDDGTTVSLISRTLSGSSASFSVSSGTVLNVAGNAIFRGDTGVGTPRQLIITSGGSTPVYLEAKGYGANYQTDFGIRTFNSVGTSFEVFYANANGNVGINQTSPSYQLDVNGTFRAVGAATFSSTGCFGGGTNGGATFAINNGTNEAKQTFAGFSSNLNLTQSYNNSSAVYVTDEYRAASYSFKIGTTAALTITSTGNVLIGTTTIAGYKVDIRSATGDADINIQPTIGTNAATLYLNNTGGGTYFGRENSAGGGLLAGSTPYATIMRSTGTNPIQFGVNNSVNFTIVNGGNVGIGTSSPTIPLQVNKAGTVNSIMTQTVLSVADSNGWNLGSDGTNALIGVTNSGTDMLFLKRVAGVYSEAMRITSGGALCLGVTSAYGTNLLNVNGGIYATSSIAAVVAADIDMFVFSNTGASYSKSCIVASITATGGTGSYFFYGQQSTSSVALKIFSNGNIQNTNNSYGAISDARLKENIKDATPKLDDLMKVKVRNYNLKGESNKQLGVISQELEAIFPNMIEESTNMGENMKIKGVKYSVFVPMLIKAVQELKQEIEILKNK